MDRRDRRRTYRIESELGWALCSSDNAVGRYTIENISIEGALLEGDPPLVPGTRLRLALHLPGCDPIKDIDSDVTRCETLGGQQKYAIEFGYLTDEEQDLLSEFIVERTMRGLNPSVIIGNSRTREGKALLRSLKSIGYRPIIATTREEITQVIETHEKGALSVVLGTHISGEKSLDLGRKLATHHPEIRRVLVARPGWRSDQQADGLFDAVVPKPWTAEDLDRALCLSCA